MTAFISLLSNARVQYGVWVALAVLAAGFVAGCGGGHSGGAPPTETGRGIAANTQEIALARLIENDTRQGRRRWHRNDTLARAARARAEDFARRGYFADTDPDGVGANAYVRASGYALPAYRDDEGANEVESIGAGSTQPEEIWAAWLDSPNSRRHLLGQTAFFAEQTEYGVGYFYDGASAHGDYWVVLTAPPTSG